VLSAPSGAIGDFAKANLQDYRRLAHRKQTVKLTILAAGSTFSGIASGFTEGRVSAQPLPGCIVMAKAGATSDRKSFFGVYDRPDPSRGR
jgi:hypothetical protein